MTQIPYCRPPRPAGRLAGLGAILCLAACLPAQAACPGYADPVLDSLDALVDRDAHAALREVQARLKASFSGAGAAQQQQPAALHAIEARAYSLLELDAEARAAAGAGLALTAMPTGPVRANLLATYWENIYDEAGLDSAAAALTAARRTVPHGSAADLCLQISSGVVEMRRDHPAAAIAALTEAYRASNERSLAQTHALAAAGLASALRFAGDYTQALELNREVIGFFTAHSATLQLSIAHYHRSRILAAVGDYKLAIDEALEARKLSAELQDALGVAFADQTLCNAQIELGHAAAARPLCDSALAAFRNAKAADTVLQTQALIARIALAEGHPESALATLRTVLANSGAELPARDLAKLYALRAQANAALGLHRDAYADVREYMRRYVAVNDAERSRQVAALRAQLETDRAIERNQQLQRDLLQSRSREALQATQLRWTSIAIGAGMAIIALLSYILWSSLRHRRTLTRLANTDPLTGLANRGRTFEHARAALERGRVTGRPVTVALLDFDRFKELNDRCGHAAGDFALREFARLSTAALRASDTLGRWGGEEFLLVLPDCSLDEGFATAERLRALTAGIDLPGSEQQTRVSISAGVSTTGATVSTFDELVAKADVALYEAKAAGRNAVRVAEESLLTASTGLRTAMRLRSGASARAPG